MKDDLIIRQLREEDWPAAAEIYLQGLKTGMATFETEVPDWMKWNQNHLERCRPAVEVNHILIGWAALSAVSPRPVYAGVAEVSIYVADIWRHKGIGKILIKELIQASETIGIWTLQAVIMINNTDSINLHKNLGFREVGIREKIGKLNGVWQDTMLLERRSKIV